MSKHFNDKNWVLLPEVGDILYSSRNPGFYKVVKVSKTQITFGSIPKIIERVDYDVDNNEMFVWYEPDVTATASKKTYRRKFDHLEPDEEYFAFISYSQGNATLWDTKPKMVFGRDNQR